MHYAKPKGTKRMKRISDELHYDMTEITEQIVDFLVLVVFIGVVMLAGLIL